MMGMRTRTPSSHHRLDVSISSPTSVASLPAKAAMGPWAPPAGDPSLESIYRVSITVNLSEGNKIISFKKRFHHSQLGAPQKDKNNPGALARACPVCPLVKTALAYLAKRLYTPPLRISGFATGCAFAL